MPDFIDVSDLDPGLMYKAIAQEEVDVICGFLTDGRIQAYNLKPLEDDRQFFPPYYAAPVIRSQVIKSHPELKDVLNSLGGRIDDATMQGLNYQVDEKVREPADVARDFLVKAGLLVAQ